MTSSHGQLKRLMLASVIAIVGALAAFALFDPKKALAAAGLGLGVWLVAGALVEMADRVRLFRAPPAEVGRRLFGLPRGAWGMTLAHLGLGLFVMGAVVETSFKIEDQAVLAVGAPPVVAGPWQVSLNDVRIIEGPNYLAEQGQFTVAPVTGSAPARQTMAQALL